MSAVTAVAGAEVSMNTYSGAAFAAPEADVSPDSLLVAPVTQPAVPVSSTASAGGQSTISAEGLINSFIPSAWQTAGAALGASMQLSLRGGLIGGLSGTFSGSAGATQSINTNTLALNAYRHVGAAHNLLADSLSKLTTGVRINTAADDAAGLAISEGLKSQVLGAKQAVRNAQDGISLVQTAEGVLGTVTDMLQRMRTLAVQGASDSYGADDRTRIAAEMDSIRSEIGRIGEVTEVLGRRILGEHYTTPADALRIQLGANASEHEVIGLTFVNVVDIAQQQLSYVPQDATSGIGFRDAIEGIDGHLRTVVSARADLGAVMNRFQKAIDSLNVAVENISSTRERIYATDFGHEVLRLTRGQILSQSSAAMLSHATSSPRGVIALLVASS